MKSLLAIALLTVSSTAFADMTPFELAHKYRFSACTAAQGAMARAAWIVEAAYQVGDISEEQYHDRQFLFDVSRFIRGLCPNKR